VATGDDSVVHVTVDWHPSYVITDGGSHGTGLTSIRSIGLDGHSTRVMTVQQSPEGVPAGSAIGQCEPAFSTVDSGKVKRKRHVAFEQLERDDRPNEVSAGQVRDACPGEPPWRVGKGAG
jgi:hypothetical protein